MIAVADGVPNAKVQLAAQMALTPTWFFAAYLMFIVVAPRWVVLWQRFCRWSIVGNVALGGTVDATSRTADQTFLGLPNYLLVWAEFHLIDYVCLDGWLRGAGRRLRLAPIGLVDLLLLVIVANIRAR